MDVEDFQQAIDVEFEKLEGFLKQLKKKGISDSKREEVSAIRISEQATGHFLRLSSLGLA